MSDILEKRVKYLIEKTEIYKKEGREYSIFEQEIDAIKKLKEKNLKLNTALTIKSMNPIFLKKDVRLTGIAREEIWLLKLFYSKQIKNLNNIDEQLKGIISRLDSLKSEKNKIINEITKESIKYEASAIS